MVSLGFFVVRCAFNRGSTKPIPRTGPSASGSIGGIASLHLSIERHPHPIHCVRPSLIRWSSTILWSIRFVHPPERRAQSRASGYDRPEACRVPPVSPSSNQQPRKCATWLLDLAVGQMEVLWPLAVSVGSPEVVSVMRPADFNSGMPLNSLRAANPHIQLNHRNTGTGQPAKRLDFLKHFLSFPTQPAAFSHFAQLHVSSSPHITIPFPRLNRAVLRPRASQNPRELRPDRA